MKGERRRDSRPDRRHNHTKVSCDDASSQSYSSQPISSRSDGLSITVRQGSSGRNVTEEGKKRIAAFLSKQTPY